MALTNSDKKFCLSNGINVEKINLHRHGRKRWSFDGVNEKSVEYAALDYFRAQGWEGYFTEHDSYWFCIGIIMGYPNWRKRRPRHIQQLGQLFHEGSDGYFSNWIIQNEPDCFYRKMDGSYYKRPVKKSIYNVHEYSFDQVWENIRTFDDNNLSPMLSYFHDINFKRLGFKSVGGAQNGLPSIRDIDIKKVESFYYAHGRDRIIEFFENNYTRERFEISRRLIRFSIVHSSLERMCGIDVESEFPDPEDRWYLSLFNVSRVSSDRAPYVYSLIEKYAHLYQEVGRNDLSEEILDCLEAIKSQRAKSDLESIKPTALDLYMWRGKELAEVEVKAPNDKLRPGQKETLLFDGWPKRWVVEVEDLNGDSASTPTTRRKSITRGTTVSDHTGLKSDRVHNARKPQNLAELADTLRAEGLWSDLMKEVVYLATQGKNVSLKERQLAQEELAARQDLSELLLRYLS
jgi:hypothetical protein